MVIFGAYFFNPIGQRSGAWAFTRLGADIALVGAVVAWQVRRIEAADLPELRAVEALGIIIPLFLGAFSGLYLGLSDSLLRNFSAPLDHVRALYFTITVFSTVGFGDIMPRTDSARLIVSAQMLLDLALIGAVVRLIFNAARTRVGAGGRQARSRPAWGAPGEVQVLAGHCSLALLSKEYPASVGWAAMSSSTSRRAAGDHSIRSRLRPRAGWMML